MTIIETIRARALRRTDAVAIRTDARTWTYADLFDAVESFAGFLRRQQPTGEPLLARLTDPFSTAVVTLGGDATGTPVIHQDPADPLATTEALVCDGASPGGRPFQAIGGSGLVLCPRTGAEPAYVLPPHSQTFLTSGSTGAPTGVVRGVDAVLADADRVARFLGYAPQASLVVAAPVFHAYGFTYGLMGPLLVGATVRYHPARSVPSQLARAAGTHAARTLIALPVHYSLLAGSLAAGSDPDFRTVAQAVSAGAPLAPEVTGPIVQRLPFTLYNCYGSSEAGAVTLRATTGTETAYDVGAPLPGVAMRIDTDGAQPGELLLRSSSLALGRITMDGAGALCPLPETDGWYRTGDLAWPSTDHQIRLAGRIDWMFKVTGKQVNPVEIEQVLAAHPDVVDVHIRAEADGPRGHMPVARVVMRDPCAGPPLVEWCRQRLAPHQVPRRIEQVPTIARSATGKVVADTAVAR